MPQEILNKRLNHSWGRLSHSMPPLSSLCLSLRKVHLRAKERTGRGSWPSHAASPAASLTGAGPRSTIPSPNCMPDYSDPPASLHNHIPLEGSMLSFNRQLFTKHLLCARSILRRSLGRPCDDDRQAPIPRGSQFSRKGRYSRGEHITKK